MQKEAQKIYNQASSDADFGYWATMDHWTLDEALVLLLGKDPRVLTRAVMKRELGSEFSLLCLSQPQRPKSEFLRRYEDLRNVAERATTMKAERLRPVDVVVWAGQSGAITPPDGLVKALLSRVRRSQPKESQNTDVPPLSKPHPSAITATDAAPIESESKPHPGTQKRWNAEALAELEAKRMELGTTGAADYFGITTARVRQLLPKKTSTSTILNPFSIVSNTKRTFR